MRRVGCWRLIQSPTCSQMLGTWCTNIVRTVAGVSRLTNAPIILHYHFSGLQYGICSLRLSQSRQSGREPQNIEHRMSNDERKVADRMLSIDRVQGNG